MYAKSALLTLTNLLGLSLESHTFKLEFTEEIKLRDEVRLKKDFKKADQIRQELEKKGIILEDTKDGTIWRRKL